MRENIKPYIGFTGFTEKRKSERRKFDYDCKKRITSFMHFYLYLYKCYYINFNFASISTTRLFLFFRFLINW